MRTGATFDETDESITHQIVDRPSVEKQYISRYYIQPQWVFDCVNTRELLPVHKYFIGEVLPPHLSPFVDKDRDQQYIPPEEKALYDSTYMEELNKVDEELEEAAEDDQSDDMEEEDEEQEDAAAQEEEDKIEEEVPEKVCLFIS